MTLEERLTTITTDLVQAERNSPFLGRLVVREAGRWEDLSALCEGLPEEARLRAVREAFTGDLRVTWLDAADSSEGPPYWIILFHSKALQWTNPVIFNGELTLEETLTDITADLLTEDRNALFLERLFAREPGRWEDLSTLCEGLPEEARLRAVREAFAGDLRATWLEDPDSAYGPGFSTILFYSAALGWSQVTPYNRELFFEEIVPRLRPSG